MKIKNFSDHGEIYIYGDIVDDLTGSILKEIDLEGYAFPADVRRQLDDLKGKPIDVYISSDGGYVSAGLAIANILKRHDAPTTAHVDSWAASIASVIALACDKVIMPAETFLMIHRASCVAMGNVDDLQRAIDLLHTMDDTILGIYKNVSDNENLWAMMVEETWLSAAEAAEVFKNVEVQAGGMKAAAKTHYENAPQAVKDAYIKNYINSVLENSVLKETNV